jgi:5S rRNA maturation endonuclease (ribonuclease M5)
MESIFLDNDWKRHMSINLETGLWQDFKTGERGNFVRLYSHIEGITYQQAQIRLLIKNFDSIQLEQVDLSSTKEIKNEDLGTLTEVTEDSGAAWDYIVSRCLFSVSGNSKKFYLSSNPRFVNRIICPFQKDRMLFYFQARTLTDQKPKYLNPTYYNNLKVSDVLYPFDEGAEYVVVCEGPIDAISLQLQGVNATSTQGCNISHQQMEALKDFKGRIIIAYDNDSAGRHGRAMFDAKRKQMRMKESYYCPLPEKFKDWNEAHVNYVDLDDWVKKNTLPLGWSSYIQDMMKYMG